MKLKHQILFKVLHKDEDNTNSAAEYIKYKRHVVDLDLKIPEQNTKQKRDLASVLYQALHQDVEEGEHLSEHTVSQIIQFFLEKLFSNLGHFHFPMCLLYI